MIVMLALLNDGAILSIAYDNVHYNDQPEAWNMRLVLGVSTVLGVIGPIAAFGLFYLADRVFHLDHAAAAAHDVSEAVRGGTPDDIPDPHPGPFLVDRARAGLVDRRASARKPWRRASPSLDFSCRRSAGVGLRRSGATR